MVKEKALNVATTKATSGGVKNEMNSTLISLVPSGVWAKWRLGQVGTRLVLLPICTAVCVDPAKFLPKPKTENLKVVQTNLIYVVS